MWTLVVLLIVAATSCCLALPYHDSRHPYLGAETPYYNAEVPSYYGAPQAYYGAPQAYYGAPQYYGDWNDVWNSIKNAGKAVVDLFSMTPEQKAYCNANSEVCAMAAAI